MTTSASRSLPVCPTATLAASPCAYPAATPPATRTALPTVPPASPPVILPAIRVAGLPPASRRRAASQPVGHLRAADRRRAAAGRRRAPAGRRQAAAGQPSAPDVSAASPYKRGMDFSMPLLLSQGISAAVEERTFAGHAERQTIDDFDVVLEQIEIEGSPAD
jgi:hypothetical protein